MAVPLFDPHAGERRPGGRGVARNGIPNIRKRYFDLTTWKGYRGAGALAAAVVNGLVVDALYLDSGAVSPGQMRRGGATGRNDSGTRCRALKLRYPNAEIVTGMASNYELWV